MFIDYQETREGTIMLWFWLNIPAALAFIGLWAGIPLWHVLHAWGAEVEARHAEIAAAGAAPAPALVITD
jgi:hypothetical protein